MGDPCRDMGGSVSIFVCLFFVFDGNHKKIAGYESKKIIVFCVEEKKKIHAQKRGRQTKKVAERQ